MALARLSVLKNYLKISSDSANTNNTLKIYLNAASETAQNITNRDYLEKPSSAIDEFYSPTQILNSRLYLRNKPLNTITSIIENYGKTGGDDTISSDDYEVFSSDGVVRFDDASPTVGFLNLKVTYQPGYDTTGWDTLDIDASFGVPSDLEYAVTTIAGKLFLDSKQGESRSGITSKSRGAESIGYTQEFSAHLPSDALLILDGYTMSQF